MNPAPNLVLIGPMGSGKTSIGKRLAERFGLRFVDVDQAIVDRVGASIPAIFEHVGEAGFRERERAVLDQLLDGQDQLVSTGGGAVLDAHNRSRMRDRSYVIYLRTRVETQLKRLKHDRHRPLLQREDREQALHAMAELRNPLYEEVADLVHDTDGLNPGQAVGSLVERIARLWQNNGSLA
ncbi:shikimate kinase [Pseudoxanthomonas kalamensis DSM 18571]|uniref:shikimate kinase n=1 Tax=Pseudoxanthomonas kalamensis TaxID=289483 RepID=UPI0013917738|nr:shikimate kinase [Pseudoxanthomonas kalamensis]KAF1711258.1 shikimate kinase [Pseudoxanthomonas kalamensis DSM 18571]